MLPALLSLLFAASSPLSTPVTSYERFAHVCPVGPTEAFTARHVTYIKSGPSPMDQIGIPLRWFGGNLKPTGFIVTIDISRVQPVDGGEFTNYFTISPVVPKIGDGVTFVEYNPWKHLAQKIVEATIVNFLPGVMILSKPANDGASGGCVFNTSGEVIGIVYGRLNVDGQGKNTMAGILDTYVLSRLREE